VFVSPCIPAGTIINDQDYEHSSIVATVRKLFCPDTEPLTWREAQAATFENVLTLEGDDIRNDVVDLPNPVATGGIDISEMVAVPMLREPTDLSVLMARAMKYSLDQLGLKPPGDPAEIRDSAEAVEIPYTSST